MDTHKQLSQMDPKLKEAYERVMSGSTPVAQQIPSSPAPAAPSPTPSINSGSSTTTPSQANGITHTGDLLANTSAKPIMQTVEVNAPETHAQPTVTHPSSPEEAVGSEHVTITNPHPAAYVTPPQQPQQPQPAHTATGTVHIGYGLKTGQKVNIEKKKLNIPPALYIVGCVVFFILYTFFWIKVFNIPLPFLP